MSYIKTISLHLRSAWANWDVLAPSRYINMLSIHEVMLSIIARLMGGESSDWDVVNTGVVVLIAGLSSFTIAIGISLVVVKLGLSLYKLLWLVLSKFGSGADEESTWYCVSGEARADRRSSSLSMCSMTSMGRDEEVIPTLTSQPNMTAFGAHLIPEWRLEFL